MRYLLDTHVFLWWAATDARLTERVKAIVGDPENEILVSTASAWEISIKIGLGRIRVPGEPAQFIPEQIAVNGFAILPIDLRHALYISKLPPLHRDPFDRMLIAQAKVDNLLFITADPALARYDVPLIW